MPPGSALNDAVIPEGTGSRESGKTGGSKATRVTLVGGGPSSSGAAITTAAVHATAATVTPAPMRSAVRARGSRAPALARLIPDRSIS